MGVQAIDRYTVRFTLKHPMRLSRRPSAPHPPGSGLSTTCGASAGRASSRRPWARVRSSSPAASAGSTSTWRATRAGGTRRRGSRTSSSVHFQVFESVSARLLAFQKGTIDYTWVPRGQVASSRSLAQVKSGEWEASRLPVLGMRYVGFDMERPGGRGRARPADPPGDRPRGRSRGAGQRCLRRRLHPSDGPRAAGARRVERGRTGGGLTIPPRPARLYEAAGSPPLVLACLRDYREAVDDGPVAERGVRRRGHPAEACDPCPGRRWRSLGTERMPAMFLSGWIADYPSAENFLYDLFFSSMSARRAARRTQTRTWTACSRSRGPRPTRGVATSSIAARRPRSWRTCPSSP